MVDTVGPAAISVLGVEGAKVAVVVVDVCMDGSSDPNLRRSSIDVAVMLPPE